MKNVLSADPTQKNNSNVENTVRMHDFVYVQWFQPTSWTERFVSNISLHEQQLTWYQTPQEPTYKPNQEVITWVKPFVFFSNTLKFHSGGSMILVSQKISRKRGDIEI